MDFGRGRPKSDEVCIGTLKEKHRMKQGGHEKKGFDRHAWTTFRTFLLNKGAENASKKLLRQCNSVEKRRNVVGSAFIDR